MADAVLRCLQCGLHLPEMTEASTGPRGCSHCGAFYQIATFPALVHRPEEGHPAESVLVEGESSCLYHTTKKASVVCAGCGAFLCTLCDIELDGRHFCPKCLARGEVSQAPSQPETRRYDSIAFHLAVWPLLFALMCFPYVMLATAPASLYFVFRYWNVSREPDGRWSPLMVWAAALAGAELVLVVVATGFMVLGLVALATG